MNRKILELAVLIKTLVRGLVLVTLVGLSITKMPLLIILNAFIIVILGGATIIRSKFLERNLKEFNRFFLIETALVLFNIIFMSVFSLISVTFADTFLVGTLLDVVINIGLFYYGVKQHKYAIIPQKKVKRKTEHSVREYVKPLKNLQIR